MNKGIDLKKFLVVLFVYLILLCIVLYFFFSKTNPFCKKNSPCLEATCTFCESKNGKKECHECSIFNEKEERVWVGNCIFEE